MVQVAPGLHWNKGVNRVLNYRDSKMMLGNVINKRNVTSNVNFMDH